MSRLLPFTAGALLAAVLFAAGGPEREPGSRAAAVTAPTAKRWQAPDRSFTVALPRTWQVEHGPAATVLQRADSRGTVVVRRGEELEGSPARVRRGLEQRLRRQLGDIRPVGLRAIGTAGRGGFVYTFVRPGSGTVQSIAVVPTAGATYTLDAVVRGADRAVAREVGAMVRSFAPAA